MYETILVPLDGSERAEAILPHVKEMAKRYESQVIFIRVVEPVPTVVGPEGAPLAQQQQLLQIEQMTEQAKTYLASLQEEFAGEGIESEMRTPYGPVVGAIIRTAEEDGADLIALASHGRTGLSRVFYGSVAAGVLHRVERPLLLIRSRATKE